MARLICYIFLPKCQPPTLGEKKIKKLHKNDRKKINILFIYRVKNILFYLFNFIILNDLRALINRVTTLHIIKAIY